MSAVAVHEDALVVTSLFWQLNAVALRAGDEAMLDRLAVLPRGAGAAARRARRSRGSSRWRCWPRTSTSTTCWAGWPSPTCRWAWRSRPCCASAPSPGAAQRELRDHDERFYVGAPAAAVAGRRPSRCRCPGRLGLGDQELELHATGGHTSDGMAVFAPWLGVLVVGDYLSPVEIPMISPGGSVADYRGTLAALAPVVERADSVVPGHGAVLDREAALRRDRGGPGLPGRAGGRPEERVSLPEGRAAASSSASTPRTCARRPLRNAHLRYARSRNAATVGLTMATNPFRYGALALDDSFTNRENELAELTADVSNGQDVVIFAPRRYGKSSLVWRASQELVAGHDVLVAQVDLMSTPTKEKLAEKLAQAIYEELASVLFKAKERMRVFQGLRVRPTVTVDPDDGTMSFSFAASRAPEDLDATLERLFELPGPPGRRARPQGGAGAGRVPGDRGHRPRPAQADAVGLPGPARGRPRLPGQQAPHDGEDLLRRAGAVLAQRQADRARRHRAGQVPPLHPPRLSLHRPHASSPTRWTACSRSPAATRTPPRSWPTSCGRRRPRARRPTTPAWTWRWAASWPPRTPTSA